jgi:hypothetical protein
VSAAAFDAAAWALAFALCVPGLAGRPARAGAALVVTVVLLHLPVAGVTPLAVLRGVFATPAVTTVAVLAALFVGRYGRRSLFVPGEALLVAGFAATVGLLFYPLALGVGPVDPYAWGYGGAGPALAAGALALGCGLSGRWVLAAALVLALMAWRLQGLESSNLWDYLIDPLLAVGGLVALLVAGLSHIRPRAAPR